MLLLAAWWERRLLGDWPPPPTRLRQRTPGTDPGVDADTEDVDGEVILDPAVYRCPLANDSVPTRTTASRSCPKRRCPARARPGTEGSLRAYDIERSTG